MRKGFAMRAVKIGHTTVGDNQPIYIVAEIGGNFTAFDQAKHLIDLAVDAGADAVKLQTYQAETISSRSAVYDMPNTGPANQFELFKKYEIGFSLHKEVWDYCRQKGIFIFSTPSHMKDLELLEKLNCQAYKIGSDDAWNIPFLKEVAAVGKPIILSTGMCTLHEVSESVSVILGEGNPNIVLLHCVTNYPSKPEDANLKCIETMKRQFGLPVGYSDHTLGTLCCLTAASLGANILEKHFTHDKKAEGPDHMLSADPDEMRAIVTGVRTIEKALGDGVKRPAAGEYTTRVNNRKSIVSLVDIPKGTVIKSDMVAIKRPGFGVPPKFISQIIGRVAQEDIKAEEPVLWKDV